MKGKFIVTVSGTDFKSEILSSTYHISEFNDEIEEILIDLFEEQWACYDPHNFEVAVYNINDFAVDKHTELLIRDRLNEKHIKELENTANEIDLLIELQKKYPNVR